MGIWCFSPFRDLALLSPKLGWREPGASPEEARTHYWAGRVFFVGTQVSCVAEDRWAVRDGRFAVSRYSRNSLYIAGHPPHLEVTKQSGKLSYHTFQPFSKHVSLTNNIKEETVLRRRILLKYHVSIEKG